MTSSPGTTTIETELECPVCLELLEDPVILPCSSAHTLCSRCAVGAGVYRDGHIHCPLCSEPHAVADPAVELKRNLHLRSVVVTYAAELKRREEQRAERKRLAREAMEKQAGKLQGALCMVCESGEEKPAVKECVECAVLYCGECVRFHPSRGKLASHKLTDVRPTSSAPVFPIHYCEHHPDYKLDLYCVQCQMPCCAHCLLMGEHESHDKSMVEPVWQREVEAFTRDLEDLQKKEATLDAFLAKLGTMGEMIHENSVSMQERVEQAFVKLQEELEQKRVAMLQKLKTVEANKLNIIERQRVVTTEQRAYVDRVRGRVEALLDEADPVLFLQDAPTQRRKTDACLNNFVKPEYVVRKPTLELLFHPIRLVAAIRIFQFDPAKGSAEPAKPELEVGQWVDVLDDVKRWQQGTILERRIKSGVMQVKIRFDGWGERWDSWIPEDSDRIQDFGLVTSDMDPALLKGNGPALGDNLGRGRKFRG